MSFEAKYNGWCSDCDDRIHEGDQVTYTDDALVHLDCDTSNAPARIADVGRMTLTYPAKLAGVVSGLLDHGWSFVLQHGTDTGDSPLISIEAKKSKDGDTVRITWHTRATGTYRLFSCMVNKRDVTLTKALEVITA